MPKSNDQQTFEDLQHKRDCAFVKKHLARDKFAHFRDVDAAIDGIARHYRENMDKLEKESARVYVRHALNDWTMEQIHNGTYDDAFDFKKRR